MRKIIFITERSNEDMALIELLRKLFPECDISFYPGKCEPDGHYCINRDHCNAQEEDG